MSAPDIDRDIKASLNVDPSPEFLARVRMRIAEEPRPARAQLRWWWIAGPAAAAVGIVAAVMVIQPPTDTSSAAAVAVTSRDVPLPSPSPIAQPTIADAPKPAVPPTGVGSRRARRDTPAPAVQLAADELKTLHRLIASAQQSGMAAPAFADFTPARTALNQIDRISVARLTIDPLQRVGQ